MDFNPTTIYSAVPREESKSRITYPGVPWPGEDEEDFNPPFSPTFSHLGFSDLSFPCNYNYGDDLYVLTNIAIEYYNSNHQNDRFELVDHLCLRAFTTGGFRGGKEYHLSFIARKKKSSSKLKLFFAAFHYPRRVTICTIVEPGNPLFQIGCGVCHPDGAIYHTFIKCEWSSVGGVHSGVVHSGYSRSLSAREASAKKFLREAYTIQSTIEDLDAEEANELKKRIKGHAMMALRKFNSKNNTFYKFLEIVSCTRFVCEAVSYAGVFWAHLVFVAEVKDVSGPVLFFAEVCFDSELVTCVVISDTDSVSPSGNESSCKVCPDVCPMFHPVVGYLAGYNGGTFADSLYKGHARSVKSDLLRKDDEASSAARLEFYKSLEC